MAKWFNGVCPKCGENIILNSHQGVGDLITCRFCDTELEITRMIPPKFRVLGKNSDKIRADYFDGCE
ncbi:MAG: hypothetical protein PVH45_04530 [Candidatus Omnitrophota bacterium]|jgi:hypothetical protein